MLLPLIHVLLRLLHNLMLLHGLLLLHGLMLLHSLLLLHELLLLYGLLLLHGLMLLHCLLLLMHCLLLLLLLHCLLLLHGLLRLHNLLLLHGLLCSLLRSPHLLVPPRTSHRILLTIMLLTPYSIAFHRAFPASGGSSLPPAKPETLFLPPPSSDSADSWIRRTRNYNSMQIYN